MNIAIDNSRREAIECPSIRANVTFYERETIIVNASAPVYSAKLDVVPKLGACPNVTWDIKNSKTAVSA